MVKLSNTATARRARNRLVPLNSTSRTRCPFATVGQHVDQRYSGSSRGEGRDKVGGAYDKDPRELSPRLNIKLNVVDEFQFATPAKQVHIKYVAPEIKLQKSHSTA